ncbi:MAG: nucleotidyltransferase domain-containing protein [Endomicrobium sp.]|jgi:predicted nucleotidyltransferase|nr:nucleotidyltransferase domain-containing protein [Endomicrobium sp.]
MKLNIEPRHLSIVRKILNENLKDLNTIVYVFGSRRSGTVKKYSDLDLAIDYAGQKIPFGVYTKLSVAFENSLLPYKVDIVDLNSVSDQFKKFINNNLAILDY